MARIIAFVIGVLLALVALGWFAMVPGPAGPELDPWAQRGGPGRPADASPPAPGVLPEAVADGEAARRAAAAGLSAQAARSGQRADGAPVPDLVCRVIDGATGAPLPGALVRATTANLPAPLGLGSAEREVLEGPSDAAGEVALHPALDGVRLAAGREVEVLVRRPGFVPVRLGRGRSMPRRPPLDLGSVALAGGLRLTGRVTGPDGRPVAGAALAFGQPDRAGLMERVVRTRGLAAEPTDGEGRFVIDELERGPFWVIVDAPGFPLERRGGVIEPGRGAGFDIRLARGATVAGRVEGAPEGVELSVVAAAIGDGASDLERRGVVMEVSVGDRTFGGSRLRPGLEYRLSAMVRRPGQGGGDLRRTRAVEPITVPAGTDDARLVWRARTRIVGRVMTAAEDAEAGLVPVTGYMVAWAGGTPEGVDFDARTFEGADGEPRRHFDDGRFAFDDLDDQRGGGRDRTMTFRVRALGHDDLVVRGVEVPAGRTTDLGELVLQRGEILRVRVTEEGGDVPVRGARVYCTDVDKNRWLGWWRRQDRPAWTSDTVRYGETDESGLALLPRPPGAEALQIGVNGDGFVPSETVDVSVPPSAEFRVELRRGGAVRVRVVDQDGTPSVGQRVELTLDEGFVRGERSSMSARTDGAGEVRFEAIPEGPASVRLRLPSMRPRRPPSWEAASSARVVVPASGEVAVDLEPWPLARIEGVCTEAGRPLAGARLSFDLVDGDTTFRPQYDSSELRAITANDGSFQLPRVPAGRYSVGVAHRSRAMLARFEVDIARGMGALRLDLPEAAVSGRVVDRASGEPLAGLRVRISGPRGEDQAWIGVREYRERPDGSLDADDDWESPSRTRTAADGTFAFRGVAVGAPVTVSVEGRFIRPQRKTLPAMAAGQTREGVLLKAPAAGAIQARVSGLEGRRWRRERRRLLVRIQRLGTDGEPTRFQRERTGRTRPTFESLPAGRYRVQLERREGSGETLRLASAEVTVVAGEQVTVELAAK